MTRFLRLVVIGLFGLVLLAVASANRAPVTLRLLPPDFEPFLGGGWLIDLPLFVVIFAGILLGIGLGFVLEWLRASAVRSAASQHRRQVGRLEREVSRLKDTKGDKPDDIMALLESR